MRILKIILTIALGVWLSADPAYAYYNPKEKPQNPGTNAPVSFREQCTTAGEQVDQDVNNVRARLTTGGDVWWDRGDGKYVVPKVEPGQQEVSSIFAGAVWLGGRDPGGNLKVACQTYGNNSNNSDFWSGPIDPNDGTTSKEICDKWDRFFEVQGSEIDEHLAHVADIEAGIPYTDEMIPQGVKGWPAKRNPYFFDVHQFDLPDTDQGLAGFFDADGDTFYDPLKGDYPIIEIRGCEEFKPQYPDEMIFWIYNDEGGGKIHGESAGLTIRMEVQVQAFGYATNDQINDMTFQRYKLINRAQEDIDSTYFAMWVDADLGCYSDDFIGCDIDRSLAYTYNADAEDGQPGITCPGGVATYGIEIPIIGIDYFRGPLDENRNELGMSSFTYHNNPGVGNPPNQTTDAQTDVEFYRYLSGTWRDGTPYTFSGDGYDPLSTNYIDYAFPDAPNSNGWSMCNPGGDVTGLLPEYDRRTVQASGPFILQPGAVNELIIGAVWVPNLDYPCPDITRLLFADDLSQALFDNCFDIVDGPDAPDVDWIELDRELIAVLSNSKSSNNYLEQYAEEGLEIPDGEIDSLYRFEGYLLYQLAGPNVSPTDFNDPTQAKLIYQVDTKNGIGTIYNWKAVENPSKINPNDPDFIYYPEAQVQGADLGIRHTFKITEDQFASSDRRLLNHRKYYFSVKAYAHNNYQTFNPLEVTGQDVPYIEGRLNIRTYAPIPRPILDVDLNAAYGDGPSVTRLDGIGVGGNFVDMTDETRTKILDGSFDGTIVYKEGRGPIDVKIYDPLNVVDGKYELTFTDENMANSKLDNEVYWKLTNLESGEEFVSDTSLAVFNEQIIGDFGFSVNIGQTNDAGDCHNEADGAIGYEQEYTSLDKPFWFNGIQDGYTLQGNDFAQVSLFVFNYISDPGCHEGLTTMGNGYFTPYQLLDYESRASGTDYPFFTTPAWRGQNNLVVDEDRIADLNNIDIVYTSDKSLWSRCVIVETFNDDYQNFGQVTSIGNAKNFDLRKSPSVGKDDANGDGLPDPDGDGIGMGWFPGYAIDVETGKRKNIFFGENSAYSEQNPIPNTFYDNGQPTGGDMMFNPTSQVIIDEFGLFSPLTFYAGGQHYIYVTDEDYDMCAYVRTRLDPAEQPLKKVNALRQITWSGFPIMQPGTKMLSYAEGLIPNDLIVKLRVDNPYEVSVGTNVKKGYPTYQFAIEGKQATPLTEEGIETALNTINVVPNPYYAFSDYEDSRLSTIVKITNLPAKCKVTIYSLDGKFIREYNRDEQPGAPNGNAIPSAQIIPDIEWDLKNSRGIPISAGVYLIHVNAPGLGERTLKWFGVTRKFDPTGL